MFEHKEFQKPDFHRHASKGFTLIEMMIAITLGAILLLGVVKVFLGMKHTYHVNEAISRVQDNARFVLDTLIRDLRMVGYRGCIADYSSVNITNVVDLDSNGSPDADYATILDTSMAGHEANGNSWEPTLSSSGIWAGVNPTVSTDVLMLSRLDDRGVRISEAMPSVSSELKVTTVSDIAENDVLLISDCEKAATFAVSQVQSSADHLQKNLTVNSSKQLSNDGTPFEKDSMIFRVLNTIYYINDASINNNEGNTVQALWRKVNNEAPEELVVGVQDLQILFGEDTDNDTIPNRYVTANAVNMQNVVTIRFSVITDSIHTVNGLDGDGLLSRSFTQTVQIRNRNISS